MDQTSKNATTKKKTKKKKKTKQAYNLSDPVIIPAPKSDELPVGHWGNCMYRLLSSVRNNDMHRHIHKQKTA